MIGIVSVKKVGMDSFSTGGFLNTGSRIVKINKRKKRAKKGMNTAMAISNGINKKKMFTRNFHRSLLKQ